MGSYANVFSPMTQEGEAMSNAVDAFFLSGAGPKERSDRNALAQLRAEKVNTERAEQARLRAARLKLMTETDQMTAQEQGIQQYWPNFVASVPGVNEPEVNAYFDTGIIPRRRTSDPLQLPGPEVIDHEYPGEVNAFGPEVERELQAARRNYAGLMASDRSKLNPDNIAAGYGRSQDQLTQRDLLLGEVDPTAFLISQGKPAYSTGTRGTTNVATGDIQYDPSAQAFDAARANQAQSVVDLNAERQNTEKSRQRYLGQRGDAAGAKGGGGSKSEGKPLSISSATAKELRNQIREQLTYAADAQTSPGVFVDVDPQIEMQILGIAEKLYQDPTSPFRGNARGAVSEAISQVSPGGWESTGEKTIWQLGQEYLVPGEWDWAEGSPDYVEGTLKAIPRPGPASVMKYPQTYYFDADGETYQWDEIEAEAKEQGVTPQQLIETYKLTPGA